MESPLLTVTVTNYNYGRFLDRAIESIRMQTFGDFELIVIDNASTDGSLGVIEQHAVQDRRVRVIAHRRNIGMLPSLRESCEVASGRYRVHVDADDWVLAPDAFAVQVDALERNPRIAFTYSAMAMVGSDSRVIETSHPYAGDRVVTGAEGLEGILTFNLTHSGMMLRLDSYRATAGYPVEYAHVADMLLGARLCEVGDVKYIDRELYAFRQHGDNVHNRLGPHIVRDEILPVIEEALRGPLGEALPVAVKRRIVQNALVHLPTQYVFAGHPRVGWGLLWESLCLRPRDTLLQRRVLNLLARSVLGQRVYDAMRALRKAGNASAVVNSKATNRDTSRRPDHGEPSG